MSGKQFVETLKRIGYPGANDLDGQSLDWIFDNEELLPFLQWFCDEIQLSNVLDPSELNEYKKLESSSAGILEGESLERALRNLTLFEKDVLDMPDERIGDELTLLTDETSCARHRKEILTSQSQKLAMHETALSDRLARIGAVRDVEELDYRKSLEQVELDNSKMNAALDSLVPAVHQLTSIYRASASGTDAERRDDCPLFLSHFDLESYHRAEERYAQSLVAFTKKQFFEGIAQMAGQNEGSRYEFLEISNPDSLLIRGEQEKVSLDDCKELARIQTFYPLNETKRINASVEERRVSATCDFHDQMLQRLRDQPYPNDIPQLSARLKSAQTHLSAVNKEIGQFGEQLIPALIRESASLQAAKILRGDYDLKISRQDYFTSNQDQLIEYLVVQRSRSEFVTMALEWEARGHRDIQKLLLAMSLMLKQMSSALEDRMKIMVEVEESSHQLQRTTVDSRDKFLHHLDQALRQTTSEAEGQQKKLFTTYEDFSRNTDQLMNRVGALRASLQSANQRERGQVADLEKDLGRCEGLLYLDSGLAPKGLPVLSPPALLDAMSQLDELLSKLEQAVMDIMSDINNKKKSLREDAHLATERELFVYFHNDANRLRRSLDDINSRLQTARGERK